MIKIKLRKNLIYLFIYYASWYIRKINSIIFDSVFQIYPPYMFLYMMTLGEIVGGLTLLLYQSDSLEKNEQTKYFGLKLIYNKERFKPKDGNIKKVILLIFAAFFDFMEFVTADFFVPEFDSNISKTIDSRLGSFTTVLSSLIYIYAMGYQNNKHRKISIIIIGSCLILIMILELVFKSDDNVTTGKYFFARVLSLLSLGWISFIDSIEKYLVDVDYMNPFKILMYEGIFEFIMAAFMSIGQDPFKEVKQQYEEKSAGFFVLLIFLFFNHLALSAVINAYKVYCNVVYTSMARSLMDYFMCPFFLIYYYITDADFGGNLYYFMLSEIISIIIDLFSCVYNEYIILYCCGLEHDTQDKIIERAILNENMSIGLNSFDDDDDDDD